MSQEPPAPGAEERLGDGDHLEELNAMVWRCHGLWAAILSICDDDLPFERGLNQLAEDVAHAMAECTEAFEAELERRRTDTCESG